MTKNNRKCKLAHMSFFAIFFVMFSFCFSGLLWQKLLNLTFGAFSLSPSQGRNLGWISMKQKFRWIRNLWISGYKGTWADWSRTREGQDGQAMTVWKAVVARTALLILYFPCLFSFLMTIRREGSNYSLLFLFLFLLQQFMAIIPEWVFETHSKIQRK
jgi:hypothetical protein